MRRAVVSGFDVGRLMPEGRRRPDMQEALESTTPLHRFVLLAVADLDARGEAQARSFDVREFCEAHVEDLEGDPFGGGGITRQAIIRALSELEAVGLLAENVGDRSPVGKGRPVYSLSEDHGAVFEALASDEHVGSVARSVRSTHD
jgi:DNA-binding HxlR family transcriptional regulator